MKDFKLSSNFVLIDIENGRKALAKHFAKRPFMGKCPEKLKVPVTITGYIDDVWGSNNGVSQKFSIEVETITQWLSDGKRSVFKK